MYQAPSVERLLKAFPWLDRKDAKHIRAICHSIGAVNNRTSYVREAMASIDRILGFYGVEDIPNDAATWDDYRVRYCYCNRGDSYGSTLIADYKTRRVLISSWGDIVERGLHNRI